MKNRVEELRKNKGGKKVGVAIKELLGGSSQRWNCSISQLDQ
jgi:hypothetical protein